MAPFGVPVVPLVYWSAAVSVTFGRGWLARSLREPTMPAQVKASLPSGPYVRASRDSRALLSGSLSRSRLVRGIASVRLTAITVRRPRSAGKSVTVL